MSAEFLLTSLVVVLVPGTGVLYTVSTGLFCGWRASIAAAGGCTLGIVPHLLASVFGLATLLHLSALVFQAVKYAGAVYLLWLAWTMWRETGLLAFNTPSRERVPWRIALRGTLINILNPKLSIFFFAFLPQFVPVDTSSPLTRMFLLGGVFMLMTLVVFVLYGLCAHGVRHSMSHSPRKIRCVQRFFALLFVVLGFRLALAEP